jgi:4-hydroxythreonine-4-phosphate dehydrogenase
LQDARIAAHLVVLADRELLAQRSRMLGKRAEFAEFDPVALKKQRRGSVSVLHHPLAASVVPGTINPANSRYVLATLNTAIRSCLAGEYAALVTAPVHKGVINDAGVAFSGHTEYLAERSGVKHVVMMLVGGGLRVALATTHLALKDVPAAITREGLTATLRVLREDLAKRFAVQAPRILVAGLNPHAGESGHLGREEIEIITPVLDALRGEGMKLIGPLPADTLFTPKYLNQADCALAMYHDQGLPVLKMKSFGHGVNVTLGLPFVRTSVDHGTALDLAGSGAIDSASMIAAIELALAMIVKD